MTNGSKPTVRQLEEGQLWRLKRRYVLIVALEDLCVRFKLMDAPDQTGERTLSSETETLCLPAFEKWASGLAVSVLRNYADCDLLHMRFEHCQQMAPGEASALSPDMVTFPKCSIGYSFSVLFVKWPE
jgi:hypothetical protein